jgi:Domain of unknown function (DUF4351)
MLGFLPTWLLDLPKPLESQLWQEMRTYEEERKMPYGYTIERIGYDRGRVELILDLLDYKVGSLPPGLSARIQRLGLKRLSALSKALLEFDSIEDLKAWLNGSAD